MTPIGDVVLDWGRATHVRSASPGALGAAQHGGAALTSCVSVRGSDHLMLLQAVESKDDVALARMDLDAALSFIGNPGLCQVSTCCIGALGLHMPGVRSHLRSLTLRRER